MMENVPGPSTTSEPTVIVPKPLNNSSITQGLLATVALLPCIISGGILGYTGVLMWDLPLTYRNASWFASFAVLGAVVGCLASRSMMDAFGPRGSILLSHVICAIGWVLIAGSQTTVDLLTGRFLTGAFLGLVSVAASEYAAECLPSRRTARPVVYTALGVLCVYVAGSLLSYAQTAAVAAVVTIVSFALTRAYVPESPAWLTGRGRVGDAEYARLRLRLTAASEPNSDDGAPPQWRDLRRPDVYKPLLAACVHFALQQLSGPLVLVSYAAQFVDDSGVRILSSHFVAVALALFLLVGGLVSAVMDHRESAIILSAAGVLASSLVIVAYNAVRRLLLNRLASLLLSIVPMVALAAFAASSAIALVPYVPPPSGKRAGPADHVAAAFGHAIAFAAVKAYPHARAYFGWWTFAFFAVAAALNTVYAVLAFSSTDREPSDRRRTATKDADAGPAV